MNEWWEDAACKGMSPWLFFSDPGTAWALNVCRACPVRVPCLDDCYDQPFQISIGFGVWGGTKPEERDDRDRAYRIAREGRPEWTEAA